MRWPFGRNYPCHGAGRSAASQGCISTSGSGIVGCRSDHLGDFMEPAGTGCISIAAHAGWAGKLRPPADQIAVRMLERKPALPSDGLRCLSIEHAGAGTEVERSLHEGELCRSAASISVLMSRSSWAFCAAAFLSKRKHCSGVKSARFSVRVLSRRERICRIRVRRSASL